MTTGSESKIVPFVLPPKGTDKMTPDEILEHLKGGAKENIVVITYSNGELEFTTNATLERMNWMLDRAKRWAHE